MLETWVQKLASTAIAVGSMFFTSITGTNATFQNPAIDIEGSQIVVSADLHDCFTEELDRILQSGKPVRFNYRVEIFQKLDGNAKEDTVVLAKEFYHQVRYNLVDNFYRIYISENGETEDVLSIGEVHTKLSTITNYKVIEADQLESDKKYYIRLTAFLHKIQLPGMKEELDLMSYWNDTAPFLVTQTFDRSMLAL